MGNLPVPTKASDVPAVPQGIPGGIPAAGPLKAVPAVPSPVAPEGSKSGDVPK
jgi:hypothetical protein